MIRLRGRLEDGRLLHGRGGWLIGTGRGQIIGDSLLFVQADATGVSSHESFIEDATRKTFKLIFFQRLQETGADLGGFGNLLEGDAASFALLFEAWSEENHTRILLVARFLGGGSAHAIILCYVGMRTPKDFSGGRC